VAGRHEDGDRCVRWLGHTSPTPVGACWKPYPILGMASLCTN